MSIDFFGDFQDFVETVTLVKRDGSKILGVKALIDEGEYTINDVSLLVEVGDSLERPLPNGTVEVSEIVSLDFQKGDWHLPSLFIAKTRKGSITSSSSRSATFHNYGQINIATDQSTFHAEMNNSVNLAQLEKLIGDIRKNTPASINEEERESINDSLEVIDEELKKPKPKKSLINTALTTLKAIKGTTEFCAAVAAIIQFVHPLV